MVYSTAFFATKTRRTQRFHKKIQDDTFELSGPDFVGGTAHLVEPLCFLVPWWQEIPLRNPELKTIFQVSVTFG